MTIREIKLELARLQSHLDIRNDPRVRKVWDEVVAERAQRIEEFKTELKRQQEARPKSKRWPDDVPADVLQRCKDYWQGTTEYWQFRIHLFNDKAIWTSYPSGGYSTAGGWNPTPPAYHLIKRGGTMPRDKRQLDLKTVMFERNSGKRMTPAIMREELEKYV